MGKAEENEEEGVEKMEDRGRGGESQMRRNELTLNGTKRARNQKKKLGFPSLAFLLAVNYHVR